MSDFELWWEQQTAWGFIPQVENYKSDPDRIYIVTGAGDCDRFKGYIGFFLKAEFDLDGELICAGVWE